MDTVWLVWQAGTGSSDHHMYLEAVCADEATAERQVQTLKEWWEQYFGSYYPVRWDQRLGERRLRSQYGTLVKWGPHDVLALVPAG